LNKGHRLVIDSRVLRITFGDSKQQEAGEKQIPKILNISNLHKILIRLVKSGIMIWANNYHVRTGLQMNTKCVSENLKGQPLGKSESYS
jgi:hypothetical protein